MQALAYDGYFKNGRFYVSGKTIAIPEERRVVITIFDDVPPESTPDTIANKKEAARNFLTAMKNLRKEGFTAEDDEAINEFQSGAFKMQFEERL